MHRIRLLTRSGIEARPRAPKGLAPLLILLLLALTASAGRAAGGGVVVSQVYAAGGNAGASFDHDFVELFNPGSSAVDLTGWSVQYASAASTSWQVTSLSGQIAPGGYFLVQLASAAAVGAAVPTPDASGTTNLAVSGGKVALVDDATALSCGASAGSCSAVGSVRDLVGYGSAADYEGGAAAPALSATSAAVRAADGCTDSDANGEDFTASAPTPRNSSSPAHTCTGSPPATSVSQEAAVDIDVQQVLSLSLERPTISFGTATPGDTPAAVSEGVTVSSSQSAGYSLTIHRTAFSPADLPLGVASTAPAGATIGPALTGGARAAIPIAPAPDLLIGGSSSASAAGGDVWPTTIGFTGALPVVAPGHYAATVTYTLIGQ